MLFNSFEYFAFLALVLTLYYLAHRKLAAQNAILLLASYAFYGLWDYRFLSLILLVTFVNYLAARLIHHTSDRRLASALLGVSLFTGLGLLALFKYYNFFAESLVVLLTWFGLHADFATLNLILPVGISFYTFQALSYTIDVYRGKLKPEHNLLNFALFMAFFPIVLAGPIERGAHLLPQIAQARSITSDKLKQGVLLIAIGLFRKVVIADVAAAVVDNAFAAPTERTALGLLMGLYLLALQIYGDFSGYSDIARGTALLMGFDLFVNFRRPYFSQGFIEFWTRWHISLSTWIRDYLFFPLARTLRLWSRGRFPRLIELIVYLVVMGLMGLWHGAAWNFVLWGLLHGLYQAIERLIQGWIGRRPLPKNPTWSSRLLAAFKLFLVFHVVTFTWLLFRSPDLLTAQLYVSQLLTFSLAETRVLQETLRAIFPVFILYGLLLLIDLPQERADDDFVFIRQPLAVRLGYAVLITLSLVFIGGYGGQPFIYYQF